MSRGYILVVCVNHSSCGSSSRIYIGNIDLIDFDDSAWHGQQVAVLCRKCNRRREA